MIFIERGIARIVVAISTANGENLVRSKEGLAVVAGSAYAVFRCRCRSSSSTFSARKIFSKD